MEIIPNERFEDFSKYSLIFLNILLLLLCIILGIVIFRKQKHYQKKVRVVNAEVFIK